MRKFLAELIGTFVLVFFGTGTVLFNGGTAGIGALGIAMAFGLAVVAMAYSVGTISGAHLNPAVSIAMVLNKRITVVEFIVYIVGQVAGAFAGSGLVFYILSSANVAVSNLGQNSYNVIGLLPSFIVEVVLTFIFVLVILAVTGKKGNSPFAGLIIGLTLVVVHLVGIPLTGTSVNPARSLAPAVLVGGEALSQVWLFIVAPLVGGIIAAIVGRFGLKTEDEE